MIIVLEIDKPDKNFYSAPQSSRLPTREREVSDATAQQQCLRRHPG
jgi:hypothetical protein